MYFALFHAVTAAIQQLQAAQCDAEDAYIASADSALALLPESSEDKQKAGE